MKISTIRRIFLENNRNISKTARELNIDRKTVRKWIKKKRKPYLISKRKKYIRPSFLIQMYVKYISPQLSGLPFTCYKYGIN